MSADDRDEAESPDESPVDAQREEAWSALALALAPIAPAPEARARLLAALRGPERFAPFTAEAARAFELSLEAVREALRLIDDPSSWQPGSTPEAFVLLTPALRAARTVISRLPAGTRIARHAHAGRELTLVLEGRLLEDGAHERGPGALLDMPEGSEHEIAVGPDAGCLVVFGVR